LTPSPSGGREGSKEKYEMPKQSPFHSRTSVLCEGESWQLWSGFLSADSYELDHSHEYNAVRTCCAVFDVSPLFKYHIRGRDAVPLLNRMVTRDISKCRVGQVMYTAWCDDEGKVVDDGTVARLEENFFRLTAAIPTLYWLQDMATGLDVDVEDVSDAQGGLAVQGPTSRALLQQLTGADLDALRFFHVVEDKVAGVPVRISRTGYTGDLGYEIFADAADAGRVWDALMETGEDYNVRPAGNIALDMVRIEAGLILIDAEFTSSTKTLFECEKRTPYELGLDWVVKLGKEYFVGQEALRREKERGPAWSTVGLELDTLELEKIYSQFSMPLHLPYSSWTEAVPVYADGRKQQHIGKATSGMWSPILKKYIVMAQVKPRYRKPGTKIFMEATVEAQRFAVPAVVVETPFFDPPRKRA
jgi:aminomethyltransferase